VILSGFRAELAAIAGALVVERAYPYPPDVTVAPAIFVDVVTMSAGATPGTATVEATIHVVTDAADHAAGPWLDDTAEALWLALLTAGMRPTALEVRSLELDVDDTRDRRAGRTVTVHRTVRPCP